MDWLDIRQALIDEGFLGDSWATVYARALGRCTYCDCDLLVQRSGYAGSERDHLIPIDDVGPDFTNLVLACGACNRFKHDHNVLVEGEDPKDALENKRPELVRRARKYVEQQYRANNDEGWESTKGVILGAVRDWGNLPAD